MYYSYGKRTMKDVLSSGLSRVLYRRFHCMCLVSCRSLLQDADHPRTDQLGQANKAENRPPHHDNLYRLVRQEFVHNT